MSATALIAVAVVVFVVLVSLQAVQDWPLVGLGSAEESASSTDARRPADGKAPVASAALPGAASTATSTAGAPERAGSGATPNPVATVPTASESPNTGTEAPGTGAAPGDASAPSASSASGSGSAVTPAGNPRTNSSPSVEQVVTDTVSEVDGSLEETTAGATKAVEDVVTQTTGPTSTVGQVAGRATDVAGGLLGEGR